ncbi:MAG: hypothetical protein UZ21_OP11001000342 [Microgenomates bacterium OLB22]|nr:MAG: hypothetical protein UZ21_OP11001000342 [Microgenomates bacterium OLB22]
MSQMTQTLSITQARAQLPEMVNSAKKSLTSTLLRLMGLLRQ